MSDAIEQVLACFAIAGRIVETRAFHSHINDSFIVTCDDAGRRVRYFLQRVNDRVFPRPAEVMENIERVTRHIATKLTIQAGATAPGNAGANAPDSRSHGLQSVWSLDRDDAQDAGAIRDTGDTGARIPSRTRSKGNPFPAPRSLTLVPARDGRCFHQTADGSTWRVYPFIEGSRVYVSARTPAQAEAAARAFGEFQKMLTDYPGPRLHETIAGFHDTPARYAALDAVMKSCDPARRAAARAEIESAELHRPLASALLDLHRSGAIPERIVHNDAKISNVLFDEMTDQTLCVVDLDTVMPGLSLFDFGDMVRSMATTAAEDEPDPRKVEVEPPLFEALTRGYLSAAAGFLNATERDRLVTAGKLITLEQAVRFLADYLAGDVYYKTARPGQNLDRARAQFKLLESIERNEPALHEIVNRQ